MAKGGLRIVQYALNPERALIKAEKFQAKINIHIIKNLLTLDKNFLMKSALNISFPSVHQNTMIYVPRHFPIIDLPLVLRWMADCEFGTKIEPLKYEDSLEMMTEDIC